MSTAKPDTLRRRACSRSSPPPVDDHIARFARRLVSVLRDPTKAFSRTVALDLESRSPIGDGSDGHTIYRIATWFLVAYRRLIILERWRAFVAEHSDLTLGVATKRFIGWLRRRGIRASHSTLYAHIRAFERRGLMGLVPQWRPGRPRRILAADRALLESLYRNRNSYRIYELLRKGAGLPGRPMSRSTVERLTKEFSKETAPEGRQRPNRRICSSRRRSPRPPFKDAA